MPASTTSSAATSPREQLIAALKQVYDPELPLNIYDLGLIYALNIDAQAGKAHILMTLTSPNCPAAELLPLQVKEAALHVPCLKQVQVELTFEPPYTTERLSEAGRLALDMV